MTRSDLIALLVSALPPLLLAVARLSAEIRHWLRDPRSSNMRGSGHSGPP